MNEQFEAEICCIVKICCGGHDERKAKAALAAKIKREVGPHATAEEVAAFIIDTFDLAPINSLKKYRDAVAEMAREYPYNE